MGEVVLCTLKAGAGEALPCPRVVHRQAAQAGVEVLWAFPQAYHHPVAHSSTAGVPCQAGQGVVARLHQREGGTAAGPREEVGPQAAWGAHPGHTLQHRGAEAV